MKTIIHKGVPIPPLDRHRHVRQRQIITLIQSGEMQVGDMVKSSSDSLNLRVALCRKGFDIVVRRLANGQYGIWRTK